MKLHASVTTTKKMHRGHKKRMRASPVDLLVVSRHLQKLTSQEHVKLMQAVEEERNRIYAVFQQAPAMIAILRGKNYILELANPPTLKVIGFRGQIIGKPIKDTIPEAVKNGLIPILDTVFKTGKPYIGNEIPFTLDKKFKKNPQTQYFNFVYQPYADKNGHIDGILVHAVEVTDQVLARQRLEELSKQKDDFLGVVSHELKTPVTSMKAYTQILEKKFAKAGDIDAVTYLMKLDSQMDKLVMLIGDLREVTKIESGKLLFNKEWFDVNELINEIVEEMQRTTERHKIIVRLEPTRTIHSDRERIGQILTNLLSNAIKYSPEAKIIILSTKYTKQAVQVRVQDFGEGISKDKQVKVFDRFYRVKGDNRERRSGMGLGLYISATIVKKLGGNIWVKSKKGVGSTFCFTLPVKK